MEARKRTKMTSVVEKDYYGLSVRVSLLNFCEALYLRYIVDTQRNELKLVVVKV